MKKRIKIEIYGRVQGVFFRVQARCQAEQLGLNGFVRNREDGSIYCEAEGSAAVLERFVSWCQQGPSSAQVQKITVKESAVLKKYIDFTIKK